MKAWEKEQMRLTEKRFAFCENYYQHKDDIRNIEALRRGAEKLIREAMQDKHQQIKGLLRLICEFKIKQFQLPPYLQA